LSNFISSPSDRKRRRKKTKLMVTEKKSSENRKTKTKIIQRTKVVKIASFSSKKNSFERREQL